MSLANLTETHKAKIGNYAGWQLDFLLEDPPKPRAAGGAGSGIGVPAPLAAVGAMLGVGSGETLTLSSRGYHAEIEAALEEGLSGGRYHMVIEGLTDADHGWLVKNFGGVKRLVAKLYIHWQDMGGIGGYLANLGGLTDAVGAVGRAEPDGKISDLIVTSVQRRLGARTYETEITATEKVFYNLRSTRIESVETDTKKETIDKVKAASGITIEFIEPKTTSEKASQKASDDAPAPTNERCSKVIDSIVKDLEQNVAGPSQVLIRDGRMIIGQRNVPYRTDTAAGTKPLVIDAETGLIEVSREAVDMGELAAEDNPKPKPKQFTLTLKGRPDLRPGELVTFKAPDDSGASALGIGMGEALAGGFAAPLLGGLAEQPDTVLYVASVLHRHSRNSGFYTIAKGTVYDDPKKPWQSLPEANKPQGTQKKTTVRSADPAIAAAVMWREMVDSRIASLRLLEAGEIWDFQAQPDTAEKTVGLSSTVSEGLVPDDGRAQAIETLDLPRPPLRRVRGVAYLTSFAWGYCGQVVPRYPGATVALGYRHGKLNDVLDLGGIWRGSLRPNAKPGDWWLTLPVDAKTAPGTDKKPPPAHHDGKVVNDLIDAEGQRIVETASFVVRVGKGSLPRAGATDQRPKMGDAAGEGITLEHKSSKARITIDKDGNITLSGKTISLVADDVDVKVKNKMKVHG
ncbi:hypothetical protein [Microvirga pakistanensis]|uniref:hypothetical protein n=1 Tax=Microvirga pakistanensis TaxID=1682650 RepID=UPI00106BC9EC|nr:hypothetical protein [Microvirga pakistanensis]